jgi:hypothetical protein
MASGTIDLGKSKQSQGRINWTATANGTTKNTSTVTGTLQVRRWDGNYTTTGTWTGSISIGGNTESYSTWGAANSWLTVKTFTVTIPHNADGTCNCYIAGTIKGPSGTTQEGVVITGGETVALDTIPRQATLTSASSFNDEENPKITYMNPLGSAAPSLQAGISLTSSSADVIVYHDIDKTAGTDTIDLTESERNTLRTAVTNSNTRTVWIYLRTRIGETYYYSPSSVILTIKNPNPTIDPTIRDSNSTTISLTGDSSKLIRYYSDAAITIGATAVKKATLKGKKVTCGNKSLTDDGTIIGVESDRFVFTATDSRGNTTSKTYASSDSNPLYSFVNYIKLSCNLANNMPDGEGNMTVKATGSYFNGSFGAKSNSLSVYYRYKVIDGSYGSWQLMTVTKSSDVYSATANLTGLDYQTTYVFQTYAKDELATVYSAEKTVKATPVFDWGETDFKFNVPVYDEIGALIGNGLAAYTGGGDSGIDPNTTLEGLCLTSHSNAPQGRGTFYFIITAFYNAKSVSASRAQIAFPYSKAGPIYHRYYTSGAWSTWSCQHDHQYVTSAGGFRLAEGWIGLYDTLANAANHTNRKGWIGYDSGTSLQIVDSSNGGGGVVLKSPGSVRFCGGNTASYVAVASDRMRASANDTYYLGDSTYRWKAVYAVNGTIQTSDRNQKKNIETLDQKYVELFDKLLPVSFMFNDAESDRTHIGFISQDVKAAMDEVGLTDLDFAGFCRDILTEWDEENQEERVVLDDDGEPIYRYSLRYTEFIALNSHMIQINKQKIQSLQNELKELKNTIDKLIREPG